MSNSNRPPVFDVTSTSARINLWLSASVDLSKEGLVGDPDEFLDPANQNTGYQNGACGHGNYGNQSRNEYVSPHGSAEKPLLGNNKCFKTRLF